MSSSFTVPPRKAYQSFHDFPIVTDLDVISADVAILDIPFSDPYTMEEVIRKLLAANILPITRGGDHGFPIPVLRAYTKER